jgi:sec-independent protein translocase protein TatC
MTQGDPREAESHKEESFISHLVELRNRLLRIVLGVLAVFLCLFPFANPIYSFLAGPLTQHLPAGSSMIAIDVASPFLAPLKLVLLLSVVIAVPWILYQVWAFVAPGLYRHERRLVLPVVISGTLLFYAGMAFAYYIMFPLAFGFLMGTAPEGVAVMTDIARYLDFVIVIFLAFGVAFQVPVITIVLVILEIVTLEDLTTKRPYVIVGAFVISAFLTPPDVISQTLLAVPMWLLFELGLIFARLMISRKHEREQRAGHAAQSEDER